MWVWQKKRKGTAIIYHTEHAPYAIVVNFKGVMYAGYKFDSVQEAKDYAFSFESP